MKKVNLWNWVKSAGVAVISAFSLLSMLPAALCEETNSTATTTTTSAINWNIDPAPLINLVISLLPAILVIVIIKSVLGSISSFARFSRIRSYFARFGGFFRANWPRFVPLAVLGLLAVGFVTGFSPVAAEETTSTVNFDVSGLINLVMSLLPLIIILVILKALMNAFSGIAK